MKLNREQLYTYKSLLPVLITQTTCVIRFLPEEPELLLHGMHDKQWLIYLKQVIKTHFMVRFQRIIIA